MIDRLKIFLNSMGGGAWPFLVGGVICLVNSVNERDLDLLNSLANSSGYVHNFLEGLPVCSRVEVRGNNRSVMPLDVLGRTRATLSTSSSLQPWLIGLGNLLKGTRAGDRLL
jgi:hypothetical protein